MSNLSLYVPDRCQSYKVSKDSTVQKLSQQLHDTNDKLVGIEKVQYNEQIIYEYIILI